METSQSHTRNRGCRTHGFTLMETMIAIVILTVGLLALAALMAKMTGTTHQSRYVGTAALLASEKLEDLSRFPACDPVVAVNSGQTTAGSLTSDVTGSVTSVCSLTNTAVPYFDEVRISAGNGSISETTSGDDGSGNVQYTTIKQAPDGLTPIPDTTSTPPAVTGDTLIFKRRWIIEKDPLVGPSAASVAGVNRITVLVWLDNLSGGAPVRYQTSMVRQVGDLK